MSGHACRWCTQTTDPGDLYCRKCGGRTVRGQQAAERLGRIDVQSKRTVGIPAPGGSPSGGTAPTDLDASTGSSLWPSPNGSSGPPHQRGVAEPGAPEAYVPPSRTRGLAIGFVVVVVIAGLLVLWVLGGVGIGPLTSLHPNHTSTGSQPLFVVRGVSLLITYSHGPTGILGPANQSTCLRCPLQYPDVNPCNFTFSIVTQIAVTNHDSVSHAIDGVMVNPSSSNSPNETWTAALWNASGGPMIGPYMLQPGETLPYNTLNSTLTGTCAVVTGSVWVSESLEWSP